MPLWGLIANALAQQVILLRHAFVYTVSHLVSWSVLSASPSSFKAQRQGDLAGETRALVSLQANHRSTARDLLFQLWTRTASESAYLLVIPLLCWSPSADLNDIARQLTYVVAFGIAAANILKDIFQLPRPPTPPVWTPPLLTFDDSASLADYAFPSSHAMNSLTNPIFLIGKLVVCGLLPVSSYMFVFACLLAALHCLMLSFSRLYLGCVFPGDITAGLVLGTLVLSVASSGLAKFDAWLLRCPEAIPIYFFVTIAILAVCPQPRPRTPSFTQTVKLLGFTLGNALGSKLSLEALAFPSARFLATSLLPSISLFSFSSLSPISVLVCRGVIGLMVCALATSIAGDVIAVLVRSLLGLPVKRQRLLSVEAIHRVRSHWYTSSSGSSPQPPKHSETIHGAVEPDDSPQQTRRVLAESVHTFLYGASVGTSIAYLSPLVFHALGV